MNRALALTVLLGGCAPASNDPVDVPMLDLAAFRCSVQPVLAKRCAFLACHGSALRPLRVYAPNRLRLGGEPTERDRPPSDVELEANYDRARALATGGPEEALLVRKPLDVTAGGLFHRGQEMFGGDDVFVSRDDPGYRLLVAWIEDEEHPPDDCVPTDEVGP
ncbi:MAG: hypothetical protein HYY06_24755 [Deltaproteobacteria bacterium]|nr:hypothetical protein [Deltaproteobacteria bacterium]